MGTIFSSNKDYNRVLAKQPRKSIGLPKFEPPPNLYHGASIDSYSIPVPMRFSQIKNKSENTTSTISNKYFEPTETLKPSNPSQAIERTNLSAVINNPTRQKSKKDQPQQKIISRNTSSPIQSNLSTHQQTKTSDAVVISRSVINLNDQREETKNHFSSSFRPFCTIVERNGQQFLAEFKERRERRYVQCIDETTHQKRLFEVIDCIPYRTVRPYKHKNQYLSQNDISQSASLPIRRSNQRRTLSPNSNDRSETVAQSKSIDNKNLTNRVNIAGEHDLQYNKINMPSTNKTPQNIKYVSPTTLFSPQTTPIPPLTTKTAADSIYQHSQYSESSSSKSLSIGPKNISDQYSSELFPTQSPSFRDYTPTTSDDSTSSSTSSSFDSDEETEEENNEIVSRILRSNESLSDYEQMNSSFFNNQNNTAVCCKTNDGYSSSTSLDPFARSLNPSHHHYYPKRSTIQNYTESIMNNRRFQQSIYPDYSPFPVAIKQPTSEYLSSIGICSEIDSRK